MSSAKETRISNFPRLCTVFEAYCHGRSRSLLHEPHALHVSAHACACMRSPLYYFNQKHSRRFKIRSLFAALQRQGKASSLLSAILRRCTICTAQLAEGLTGFTQTEVCLAFSALANHCKANNCAYSCKYPWRCTPGMFIKSACQQLPGIFEPTCPSSRKLAEKLLAVLRVQACLQAPCQRYSHSLSKIIMNPFDLFSLHMACNCSLWTLKTLKRLLGDQQVT